jgi:hypothetical protein
MGDLNNLLQKYSERDFLTVFSDWSKANLINDLEVDKHYGYLHPLRKNSQISATQVYEELPAVLDLNLSKLSASLIEFPLTEQLDLNLVNGGSSFSIDGLISYPSGGSNFLPGLIGNTIHLDGKDYPHGKIKILLRNEELNDTEEDISSNVGILATGKKSDTLLEYKYDDGTSDQFFQNASYFLLSGYNQKFAVAFGAVNPLWLKGVSIKAIFLSELQGSPFPGLEKRDISVQVMKFDNGAPSQSITEPIKITFNRDFGNLRFEDFSLDEHYNNLSAIADSFCLVFSNDDDDSNFVAIGMDNSQESSSFLFSDKIDGLSYKWAPFDSVQIEGVNLKGWNGMVRANVVTGQKRLAAQNLNYSFSYDYNNVHLNISAPFVVDSIKSRCAVKTPQNSYKMATSDETGALVSYSTALEIGDSPYQFYVNLQEENGLLNIDTVLTWEPPFPSTFNVFNNYPNPFNIETTIPFSMLSDGVVSYEVYNILGQKVSSINRGFFPRGKHSFNINFTNNATGVYFIIIKMKDNTRQYQRTQKVVLLK